MAPDQRPWSLQSGHYLGEISALCFLPLPHISPSPFLLAGTGSQVIVYDVDAGKILNSFHVFRGIRVHGISCSLLDLMNCGSSTTLALKIAIFGERRVKIYSLHFDMNLDCQSLAKPCLTLKLILVLPRFSHWVMDVCFLKEDPRLCEHGHDNYLAVGLSDNSLCLWDISRSSLILEVKGPERCLLYSMRLWGDNLTTLHVASGTIYNEIIVWKLVHRGHVPYSARSVEVPSHPDTSCCKDNRIYDQQYVAVPLSRLIGHEGSIFRIAWCPDGSKVISVSDDRSARIWTVTSQREDSGNLEVLEADVSLFGHNARVWDCYISDYIIITCGEDCTCRVWGLEGNQLMVIKEHSGRGIWRCLYDPSSLLLITAGFDSAIKVHPLPVALFCDPSDKNRSVTEFQDKTEIFTTHTPNLSEKFGLTDSKSEYVRCLRFSQEDALYVATNHGYLYHVKLLASDPMNVKWTELVRVNEVPIVCMDLLSMNSSDICKDVDDWIAIGDGKGNVTLVGVANGASSHKVVTWFTWLAEKERQLLGIYWCNSLGYRYLFTTDPRGRLKLWRTDFTFADETCTDHKTSLVAEFTSCFGMRIICLDASFDDEVLVCGDQRGNLDVFSLPRNLLLTPSTESDEKISSLAYFRGAHGISSVTSILVSKLHFNEVEIRSTGGDGCICYFKYYKDWRTLEFTGMKQVKELSLVQSVFANSCLKDMAPGNYAVGFASTDFIIWNLANEIKVFQVPCGGWRRPHSYFLGDVPELQFCFAYLKDHTIHVYRHWVPTIEKIPFPKILHMQFHGREIHSVCFISVGLLGQTEKSDLLLRLSWVATGCEDGTVRLTRYGSKDESWSASKLLGEHVGGSSVRSVCFIAKIHKCTAGQTFISSGGCNYNDTSDSREGPILLISVGAKRVLTSWLLRNRRAEETHIDGTLEHTEDLYDYLSKECSSVSFQWLSTHMPQKFSGTCKGLEKNKQNIGQVRNLSIMETGEQYEDDWRYLAVTAFLVKGGNCRTTVCFVVVACSDTTLTVRALLLPHRLWFEVAVLIPQTSPVLSLQHVTIPIFPPLEDKVQMGNMYLVVSGSTDGSITFWDLTETVECFMHRISIVQPEKVIDCQRRPRTGRGSQGGRQWRSLTGQPSKNILPDAIETIHTSEDRNGQDVASSVHGSSLENDPIHLPGTYSQNSDTNNLTMPEMQTDDSLNRVPEVQPLHVLNSVHQSGVNCLHVSDAKDGLHLESESVYHVLSGGDDQALHCLSFNLVMLMENCEYGPRHSINTNETLAGTVREPTGASNAWHCSFGGWKSKFRILFQDRIASAHSSAVKGVWTDGTWVFSTGLDQRVRCWCIGENGKLDEHSHLIISVPEPETLDARACGRNQYQIAVAGRGMQLIEFSAPPVDK